jgi:hypothetical protein
MPARPIQLDDYILDTLLRDLTGHDRKPAAFLVYLWLAGEQSRRRHAVAISYQELAENTGLSRSAVPQAAQRGQGQRDRRPLLYRAVPLASTRLRRSQLAQSFSRSVLLLSFSTLDPLDSAL